MTKVCTKCKEEKSLDSFYKDSYSASGRRSCCSTCDKQRYRDNKERLNQALRIKNKAFEQSDEFHTIRRICTSCGIEKSLIAYNRKVTGVYGRSMKCKVCSSISHKQYVNKNVEVLREYRKEWYKKNREVVLAKRVQYVKDNPEKIKAWRVNNPEKAAEADRRSRAKRKQAEVGFVHPDAKQIFLQIQRDCCGICWEPIEEEYPHPDIHLEHIVPLSRGGIHDMSNLQVAHGRCNDRKLGRTQEEYEEYLRRIGEIN